MPAALNSHPRTHQLSEIMSILVRGLVDDPQAVRVIPVPSESRLTLQIGCADGDVGKLIGIQGRTARALRTILVGLAQGCGEYDLDILRPGQPTEDSPPYR